MTASSSQRLAPRMVAALAFVLVLTGTVRAQLHEESFAGPNYARPEGWTAYNAPDQKHWFLRDGSFISGDGTQTPGGTSYAILDTARFGGQNDYTVSTGLALLSGSGRAMIVARWSDAQTHYEASYEVNETGRSMVRLDRITRGRRTTLATYDRTDLPAVVGLGPNDPTPTLSLTVRGEQLRVAVNGRVVIDHRDDLPLRTGTAGLGQFRATARFRDFRLSPPVEAPGAPAGGGVPVVAAASSEFHLVVADGLSRADLTVWQENFADAKIDNARVVAMGDKFLMALGPYPSADQALLQKQALLDEGFVLQDVVSGLPGPAMPLGDILAGAAPTPGGPTLASPASTPSPAAGPGTGGGPWGGAPAGGGSAGFGSPSPAPAGGEGGQPAPRANEEITFIAVRAATFASYDEAVRHQKRLEDDGFFQVLTLKEGEGFNVYVGRFDDATIEKAHSTLAELQRQNLNPLGLFRVTVVFTPEMIRQEAERDPTFARMSSEEQRAVIELMRRMREEEYKEQQNTSVMQELVQRASELGEAQREFMRRNTGRMEELESTIQQLRDARERDERNTRRLSELRNPFHQALQDDNFVRAEQLLRDAERIDPSHSLVTTMRNALDSRRSEREDRDKAKGELDHLIRLAREREADGDWATARGYWQQVQTFRVRDLVTSLVVDQAQEGIRRCNTAIQEIDAQREGRARWMGSMIWGTIVVVGCLAVWFFYYHVTTRRRVVKIMEEALPEMALPALDLGGDPAIPQLEARASMLALPEGSGSGGGPASPGRPSPGASRAGARRPSTGSGTQTGAATSGSGTAAASASASRMPSRAHLAPTTSPAADAPKAPDLASTAGTPPRPSDSKPGVPRAGQADPKTVVLPPDEQKALGAQSAPRPGAPAGAAPQRPGAATPGGTRPGTSPGKDGAPDRTAAINLSGLPDLPDFDNIVGGAQPKAASAVGQTAGPAFDIHTQPTRLDFEAVVPPAPAATPAFPGGSDSSSGGFGSLLEGLSPATATPSPDAGRTPASTAGPAPNGVFFAQDFADVAPGGAIPHWEGSFDFATLDVTPAAQYGNGAGAPTHALRYEKKTGSGQVYYYCNFPTAKGNVTVEFDLCCVEKNRYLLGLYLEKDRDFRRSIHTVIHCASPRAKASLRLQGTPAAYDMGSWAHVKYVLNMHRNTLSAFVDGHQILDNETVENMPDSINTFAIRDNHPTTGVLLMSNLKVYQSPKSDD